MMSWPATLALTIALSTVAAAIVIVLQLGSLPAALLCLTGIALVKVISKRPEFDGLPAPPPK